MHWKQPSIARATLRADSAVSSRKRASVLQPRCSPAGLIIQAAAFWQIRSFAQPTHDLKVNNVSEPQSLEDRSPSSANPQALEYDRCLKNLSIRFLRRGTKQLPRAFSGERGPPSHDNTCLEKHELHHGGDSFNSGFRILGLVVAIPANRAWQVFSWPQFWFRSLCGGKGSLILGSWRSSWRHSD